MGRGATPDGASSARVSSGRPAEAPDESRATGEYCVAMSEVPAVNLEGAVPSHLPVLPLKSTVVFPRIFIPLSVGRKKSLQLLDDLSGVERHITVATQLHDLAEEVGFEDLHPFSTMVRA